MATGAISSLTLDRVDLEGVGRRLERGEPRALSEQLARPSRDVRIDVNPCQSDHTRQPSMYRTAPADAVVLVGVFLLASTSVISDAAANESRTRGTEIDTLRRTYTKGGV